MNPRKSPLAAAALLVFLTQSASLASYHLERISPVLNQPTYLTQAPGDPANILYYTTRINGNSPGYNATNPMGSVWRYDINTRVSTEVLSMSSRSTVADDGIQSIAFHPDFNSPGAPGYGKLYVSSATQGTVALNRVEEFTLLDSNGAFKSVSQVFSTARIILSYNNSRGNNHTVDWIGFNPNASGAERNYLYISTGDGSFGNIYNYGYSPDGRPSQNPGDVKGKFLRVDISGGDDYPTDASKNFVIPPSNPIPTYNLAHPSKRISGLGEVYVTGVRNAYRASFDRANSDLYWGDVGENAYEEVSFLKAGSNGSGPPVDFGWPQSEGTHDSTISGAPHTTTNPFTGAQSLYPLQEYSHSIGHAAIGGYVYRGPITELQGKYFYGDFVAGKVWMLDFDRNTDPTLFAGTNGTLTDVTAIWNAKITDPTTPDYAGDNSIATLGGIDHVVSLGEDNNGNLYVVDFGYGSGFSGQYAVNAGEIFMLVPDEYPPTLTWTKSEGGGGLHFSWFGNYKLQTQTNDVSSENWSDYPGGGISPVDVPFDPAQHAVFFRLMGPP
ncbi:MAG: PQQ-dependent sugar dehydrogenase [Luteolibacter sp.]